MKPKVVINDSVFEGLCAPWQDALVVKLLGKRLGYFTMKDKLSRLWKLSAGFDILDIGNGYYMAKFDVEGDRMKVMDEGLWMVFDHYLTVQTWTPEFTSPTAKIERTMVWIRFPGLNLFYYDESILMAMAAAVGRPIKVDKNTLDVRRGRFARVCVEVDLTLPVVGKVWLRDHWYQVEYEGLHRICSRCGCYGHLGRDCNKNHDEVVVPLQPPAGGASTPMTQPGAVQLQPVMEQPQTVTVQKQPEGNKEAVGETSAATLTPEGAVTEPPGPLHGEWLMVKRKSRNNKLSKKVNDNAGIKAKSVIGNDKIPPRKSRDRPPLNKKEFSTQKNEDNIHSRAPSSKKGTPSVQHNHKRPRKETESKHSKWAQGMVSTSFQVPKSNFAPTPSTHAAPAQNQTHIYDVGNGAKSTVPMQAVTGNRYILLEEESENAIAMDAMREDVPQLEDMVPETQHEATLA